MEFRKQRTSFRYLPGWYEAPYDVLRFLWRNLGDPAKADRYEAKYRQARDRRIGLHYQPNESVAMVSAPSPRISAELQRGPEASRRTRRKPAERVAVLGLYSSGSTAKAGVLHHLGVCLGQQYWSAYFEPRWLMSPYAKSDGVG